jgi:hypothetical protein
MNAFLAVSHSASLSEEGHNFRRMGTHAFRFRVRSPCFGRVFQATENGIQLHLFTVEFVERHVADITARSLNVAQYVGKALLQIIFSHQAPFKTP